MTYPLPTNWAVGSTFTPTNNNNVASLVNTLWLIVAAIGSQPTARVATVGTETFTIVSGSVTTINGTTIDGVSVSATGALNGLGDYVLIKDAPATTGVGSPNSTQPTNGLYQVTAVATNITLQRATPMSSSGGASTPAGMIVGILAGTVNAGFLFMVSNPANVTGFTYGTTNIAFTQININLTSAQTFTNKRITKRVGSTASTATPTFSTDSYDVYQITALATGITGWASVTGTPQNRDDLTITIKDNGTSQSIVWSALFISSGVATLPTVTPAGKQMTLRFTYDSARSAWVLMALDAAGY